MNDSMRVSPGLPSIPVFIGAVLIVLGAIVILGWLLKIPELVRVVPGFAPMVFNTALCFMLLGAALATASQTWRQRVQPMLGGFTIAIAVLVLSQDLFSIDVGIDHLFSADWLHDPRPHPTRMAPNTAVAFILSGATLILFNLGRRPWVVNLARYMALAVMLIGLTAVLGYLLKLEFLFAWYPNARMAVHTASGFTLLGIGLWGYRRWTRTTSAAVDSPDERILLAGNVILIVLALVGSVSGFFIFGKETEAFLRRSLERSLYNRVEIYQDYLQHAIKEAKFIAHRPGVLRELRTLPERHGQRISFPVEVRVAPADDIALSTASGRDTAYVAVHVYRGTERKAYFDAVETLMGSVGGRPHWGKLHSLGAAELRARYPRFDEFVAVRDRLDPERRFTNPYLDRVLGP